MRLTNLIRNSLPLCLGLILLLAIGCGAAASNTISLAGQWRFGLDATNVGISEKWFEKDLSDNVRLPGSTDSNKKGTPNDRKPDMQHLSRLYEYTGPAWYQRDIDIPESWKGKRVSLFLERCHWETQVWLDGKQSDVQDSLCIPHVHDLGIVEPGPHRLAIRVDNAIKYDIGGMAHAITEETQTNWNGIIGRIELRATPLASIENVQVYPNIKAKSIKVKAFVRSDRQQPLDLIFHVHERGSDKPVGTVSIKADGFTGEKTVEATIRIPNAKLWDEFSPTLYDLDTKLEANGNAIDASSTTFGMREIAVRDKRIEVNGRKIFVRGTLECCIFPRTGYPPTDIDSWLRIFRICKSYGLNAMRFHSWCPPEAAFAAADRMGFMLHVEAPHWAHDVGKDKPRDEYVRLETQRILDTYGNHPSFCFMCMGNELLPDVDYLQESVMICQKYDPRRLYSASTAYVPGPHNDYFVGLGRGLHADSTDKDFRDVVEKSSVPVIGHEIGQWAVLPNLAEIPKYNGVLRARNFELLRDNLDVHNLLDQAVAFTEASGKLSVTLYKEEIEVLMRTPGHCGFELLDLHDFPGQGTSTVGLLDAFWDSKGLITPEAYRRFCGPTVPLLRMPKRTYTTDETFTAGAEISHFGPKDIANAKPKWSIADKQGQVVASGTLPVRSLPTGELSDLGSISVPLASVKAPGELIVTVSLDGSDISNDWHIWVYPARVDTATPKDVLVTSSPNDAITALTEGGRRVVMLASAKTIVNSREGSFTPVFWSPVLFRAQAVKGMGILCDPTHPALAEFPTDSYTNWQWYDLLTKSRMMVLDGTPADFRPIVQFVDNFTKNQKLGALFEARVWEGKLIVCSIDLSTDLDKRPAARQLLKSILDYAASPAFEPYQRLTVDELDTIIGEPKQTFLQKLGAVVTADSEDIGNANVAANIIDGDPSTFWDTEWAAATPPFPHEVKISLPKPIQIVGFRYLPRQDMSNGWFTNYEFYASSDGKTWGDPIAKGTFASDANQKIVHFDKPVTAQYFRLVALKGYNDNPWAAIAEFEVIVP